MGSYTYGYISNYLVPFLNVGGIAAWHVNDTWDLSAGIDCGSQTSFGSNDNNCLSAGYFGFGLNRLLGGKLSVLAMSRLGPEDSLFDDKLVAMLVGDGDVVPGGHQRWRSQFLL